MRQAIGNNALDLGFKLDRKRSKRHNLDVITDLDFADDIALVTGTAAKIGLHLNLIKLNS